ncbi:acyl carrier protein [Kitasatospora sp. MAP5-34]|uniref:acyl carrier protein n=1 Tax=Kitasatospora sp. MAP5-34 TaxID=3035102 RepID=UPI002476CE83|nr:acyl carrier protein [Kitasatospora sp. MAP5-34]MDH6580234.1 acyl carrier protein [Kitasatospora sp. MAP5-34]
MTTTTISSTTEIRDWLRERVAFYLERPIEEIDSAARLVEYGLDSLYALTLCGDIEDEFDITVPPTLAWDFPSVNAIAEQLHDQISEQRLADR